MTTTDVTIIPPEMDGLLLAKRRPVDRNPAAVYLASLSSDAGRRSQNQVLRVIAGLLGGELDTVNWAALRYQHTAALRTRIVESGYSPASVRKFFAALRGVLRHAWRLGQMSAEDYQRATDLGKVGGSTLPRGRYVTPEETKAMMEACMKDSSTAGVRDAAMLGSMYFALLRRDEVTALNLDDYDSETGRTVVRGKGRKERINFITNGAAAAMKDWLTLRGKDAGPLFLAIGKTGKIRPKRRLSDQAVYNMIDKRIREAGLEDVSPHDFRRTGISDMLDATGDLALVSKAAGHNSPQTTARYDRRPEGRLKDAAGELFLPYNSRTEVSDAPE